MTLGSLQRQDVRVLMGLDVFWKGVGDVVDDGGLVVEKFS